MLPLPAPGPSHRLFPEPRSSFCCSAVFSSSNDGFPAPLLRSADISRESHSSILFCHELPGVSTDPTGQGLSPTRDCARFRHRFQVPGPQAKGYFGLTRLQIRGFPQPPFRFRNSGKHFPYDHQSRAKGMTQERADGRDARGEERRGAVHGAALLSLVHPSSPAPLRAHQTGSSRSLAVSELRPRPAGD